MKYSEIDSIECCNGFGWGVSLYTQGCHFHCKGCFNPETWDFDGGKEFTEKEQNIILSLMDKDYIERVSVLGGEPLEERNISTLVELIGKIKTRYPEKKVWLYTGYTAEEVLGVLKDQETPTASSDWCWKNRMLFIKLISMIDILVAGPFKEDEKDLTYPFAGSRNQKIIDVPTSIMCSQPILHEV